ncbi:glycoside hydrolase family 29 protein [Coniophora puteana RWD-64-598 SS2]|uniref:alpha-L-fucosidase n=1 Tax=Coniophora puteana (strain RWD-64-598) TaxID=741705 RepID=A0A5M3MB89_CONPW|nr:glycoside hydrolase family 29 protein [Coniophora puteana RWD-64-598 SS2]EIW76353.1 glycoside hydrolase family 29 protein [Coniophora puteana RWD-64-598 SS2]
MPPRTSNDRTHLFALSVTPALPQISGPSLSYRRVRPTSRWEAVDGIRAQVYEVTLANLVPDTAFETGSVLFPLKIEMFGATVRTVKPGVINRLTAGDQVVVDVLVENPSSVVEGGELTVVMTDNRGNPISTSPGWPAAPLRENFGLSTSALESHETPTWWNEAKFGIFIHWGPYSVPGWGPGYTYAEWYDWHLHSNPGPNNAFYEHQMKTYGKEVVYDDFFANLTGSKFNASEWVNLFDDAGAKYFVFTTKHHDGFGMFDTGATTHRNSLHLGPKRDFLRELFDTAKAEKPQLHRGTYFSMPEWFSPDYAPYGFDTWPGGLARNVFNQSEVEPYTGRLPIKDYLADLQLPQMVTLAEEYDTEIMWCDISSANLTRQFAQHYFTHAWAQGRQVVINDRCGDLPDHDTPEYAKLNAIQTRKWETSEGMDPSSYGYNRATPASAYKNGTAIVQTLVDIVSKNGNYLLDVGPTAEGVIPDVMQQNLLDAGRWLKYAGDCVYATEYWFRGSEDPTGSIRFLTTPTTFCIVSFERPSNGRLVVQKRVPITRGDRIHLLSPHGARVCVDSDLACGLPWSVDRTTGYLTVDVSDVDLDLVEYAWAFQIQYNTYE